MKREKKFQMLPKELHQLKYEDISVPQVSVHHDKRHKMKKFNLQCVDHQKCHEFKPSTTKDPLCRGEMYVKSVESSNVLLLKWCGSLKWPAQVSSSSLDYGSKLRGMSPKALV
ncbi:hypothetical protein TNCV_1601411 [Trichonephila clavipes]|nr:hypothetical protein TNCV_1601411 [Trichonephila clavipes]